MKILIICLLVIATIIVLASFRNASAKMKAERIDASPKSFYDLSYKAIDGGTVNLSDFKGKYILFVNVASECGNTPQYVQLEELYEKHKNKLVIIGFPCNQFGGQEPGAETEIKDFCSKNYGVTFPLASKVDVKGAGQHPVYTWLTNKELNGVKSDGVGWNFHKYLVSPTGEWLASFGASMDPGNGEIEKFLK